MTKIHGKPLPLKEALKGRIPSHANAEVPRAYDIVGSIAILELPRTFERYENIIGKTLLEISPHITTVCKKVGGHAGRYRRQAVRIIAGKRTKTTIHKESGLCFKVHVQNAYFSPRLSGERMRVAHLVNPGEKVLVMFSGIAPYPLVIALHAKASRIIGIEMNPASHALGLENINLNKKISASISLFCGDVNKVIPKIKNAEGPFDRIVMPLPKGASDYLDAAFSAAKPGTVLHFYYFAREDTIEEAGSHVVKKIFQKGYPCTLLGITRCGQAGVREYRICADIRLDKTR